MKSAISSYVPVKLSDGPNNIPWRKSVPAFRRRDVKRSWLHYKTVRGLYGRRSIQAVSALQLYRQRVIALKEAISSAVCNYELSLLNDCTQSRRFHGYLRSKKVGRVTVGPLCIEGR